MTHAILSFAYQDVEMIEDLVKSEYADYRIDQQPADEILRMTKALKEKILEAMKVVST